MALLEEIAVGLESGEESRVAPLVRKAVRLAASLGLHSYTDLLQCHLDGVERPKGSRAGERGVTAAEAFESANAATVAFIADRAMTDGRVASHALPMLEELHARALKARNDVGLQGIAENEYELREILQRIRSRVGKFVIAAEHELAGQAKKAGTSKASKEVAVSIQEDASLVVQALARIGKGPDDPQRGRYNVQGQGVLEEMKEHWGQDLSPERINDAVVVLERNGHVKTHKALGTRPFDFRGVELTPEGRHKYEQEVERMAALSSSKSRKSLRVPGSKIFIGHGGSPAWRDLKDFLRERLTLEHDEFDREPSAGQSRKERLQQMLDDAAFAFLVMTAEDQRADGTKVARANVIHEVGLFQGRLGFERAIVLLEDGCDEFSNIAGLTQIRFPAGNISAKFEEIRRVLEREGLLPG